MEPKITQEQIDQAKRAMEQANVTAAAASVEYARLAKIKRESEASEIEKRQRETLKTIGEKTKQARALLTECEQLAREAKVMFGFPLDHGEYFNGDPTYGSDLGWCNSSHGC